MPTVAVPEFFSNVVRLRLSIMRNKPKGKAMRMTPRPALGRQSLHLSQDAEAFADDVADLVEDLREDTTRLS